MNASRRGGVFIRLVAMLLVAAVAGVLCWAALNYQRATGTWAFHPLDPAWWSPARTAGPPASGKEALDDARIIGDQVGQALWGKGGMVERIDLWWGVNNQNSAANPQSIAQPSGPALKKTQMTPDKGQPLVSPMVAAPAAPSATPSATQPTTVRGILEQRLSQADATFKLGFNELKAASPIAGDATMSALDRLARVSSARQRFVAVERDLAEAIPAYEAIPGHDVRTTANARQLRSFNQQMLELTGGLPAAH